MIELVDKTNLGGATAFVMRDTETNVHYLWVSGINSSGLTPMYNPDGSLYTGETGEEE